MTEKATICIVGSVYGCWLLVAGCWHVLTDKGASGHVLTDKGASGLLVAGLCEGCVRCDLFLA